MSTDSSRKLAQNPSYWGRGGRSQYSRFCNASPMIPRVTTLKRMSRIYTQVGTFRIFKRFCKFWAHFWYPYNLGLKKIYPVKCVTSFLGQTWTSVLTLPNHLSKRSLLACNLFHKNLSQPQIPFEIFCPIPHGGVCRIPNPSKNLSCVSFLWEKTCVKFIFIPYSSYPVASWPVCKLFLLHLDPSANSSFGILTRLQTFPLASCLNCLRNFLLASCNSS